MDTLGFYPLTIILTYLGEYDGVSLLVTKKHYAKTILPMFRLRASVNPGLNVINDNDNNNDNDNGNNRQPRRIQKNRHCFKISPVQGPVILLQRLNTRRYGKRSSKRIIMPCIETNTTTTNATTNMIPTAATISDRTGLSTVDIANQEWATWEQQIRTKQKQQRQHEHEDDEKGERGTKFDFPYPPPLELLRFLDQIIPDHQKGGNNDDRRESIIMNDLLLHRHQQKQKDVVTLLVSYPRSGNTLIRTLFERITGIVTGSDTRPDRSLSKALAEAHNLVGEGVTSSSKTCFIKTHWPERVGCRVFNGHRAIMIIRNPYDAIDSYWNLNVTNTHTETVTDEIYEQHHKLFEQLAQNEIQIWCQFHQFWLDKSRCDNFPLCIIRFEDLVQNPKKEMIRMMEFIIGMSPLDSYWQQRIVHATRTKSTTTAKTNGHHHHHHPQQHHNNNITLGSYKPRTATKGVQSVGKSLCKQRYSNEIIQYFHTVADACSKVPEEEERETVGEGEVRRENLLKKFGYGIIDQNFPENFVRGGAPELPALDKTVSPLSNSSTSSVRVNSGSLIRPRDCPFGRSMRAWRLKHTENDTKPFPRVPRVRVDT